MTTEQTIFLPITEMLEKRANIYIEKDIYGESFKECASVLKALIIPQVRTLELETIAKAKQEEREKILKEFEYMINMKEIFRKNFNDDASIVGGKRLAQIAILQEAIERIT